MPVRSRPALQWTRTPLGAAAIAVNVSSTMPGRILQLWCQYSGESRIGKQTSRNSRFSWSSVGAFTIDTVAITSGATSGSPSRTPIS
ncbi:MAG TPA: hypothetical protein VGM84_04235 [Steroidobacteraceae bacterium]|jgi:hypothetical protein